MAHENRTSNKQPALGTTRGPAAAGCRQTHRWIVDALLFAGFLLSCILDLTGLDLHQVLGAALAALAIYHLATHWTWVTSVTARFFGRTSGQARLYYTIDVALALSLSGILATGVLISTWLSLPLGNYWAWRNVHVIATLASLALVVVKVALHWRWVVSTAKRFVLPARPSLTTPALALVPVTVANDRRQFLKALGVVSGVAALSAANGLRALLGGVDEASGALTVQAVQTETSAVVLASTPAATATTAATAAKKTVAATATPTKSTATASAATGSTSSGGTSSTCVIRCSKRCSYPGRCRKYVDSNKNNLCDLGECA